jgi:hypothetical protein
MKNKNKSTVVYVIAGIIIGYISFLLNDQFLALGLVVVVLFLIAEALKRVLKLDTKFTWFWSHGGWIYLFVWFITWVILYNL